MNRGPSAYQPNALPLGQTGSRCSSIHFCPFIGVLFLSSFTQCIYFVLPEGRAKMVAQGQQECIQHIADFIKGKMYEAMQQRKRQTPDTHRLPAYWQVVCYCFCCFCFVCCCFGGGLHCLWKDAGVNSGAGGIGFAKPNYLLNTLTEAPH